MAYSVSYREAGSSEWVTLKKVLRSLHEVWTSLYCGQEQDSTLGLPERVRIGRYHGEGMVQSLFEGSYPAAIMWLLGIWGGDATFSERSDLERNFKKALCITSGECADGVSEEEGK